jgi:glycosyltransferase involved in cell wall biosynthesis
MSNNNIRIAFIHGRPSAHPAHIKYAQTLGADFYPVDYKLRYHDLPEAGAFKRYLSWVWSALAFPKSKYDVIFSEEAYFTVGLMRWLGLLKKEQKIIAMMNTHTLYFLNHDRYSPSTKEANIKLLKRYDGFICGSLLQRELLYNLIGRDHSIPVYTMINGVEPTRLKKLIQITSNVDSKNIVFIGAVSNSNRAWYKGLDLMLAAFSQAKAAIPELTFTIIGDYEEGLKEALLNEHCPEYKGSVNFTGNVGDIENYLKDSGLYLHISRGEAWGISVTEAMAAGIVPIVSDSTGSKEAVTKVDERLVSTSDVNNIAQKVKWYFNLPFTEKVSLSNKCREVVISYYKEEDAILTFKDRFTSLIGDLGVKCQ